MGNRVRIMRSSERRNHGTENIEVQVSSFSCQDCHESVPPRSSDCVKTRYARATGQYHHAVAGGSVFLHAPLTTQRPTRYRVVELTCCSPRFHTVAVAGGCLSPITM